MPRCFCDTSSLLSRLSFGQSDIVGHVQMREQGGPLEDQVQGPLVWRAVGDVLAEDMILPAVGTSRPAIIRRRVVLPQPLGPRQSYELPGATLRSNG